MKITCYVAKAFSLLELMVTLAIVLIITIIAVPAMDTYINQSKVSDALSAASEVQVLVANNIAANETVTGSGSGLTLPNSLGRYVASFSVSTNGVISFTTVDSASAVSLTLTPSYDTTSGLISWVCAVTDATLDQYVPIQCRI